MMQFSCFLCDHIAMTCEPPSALAVTSHHAQHLKREAELIAERVARLDNQKMQKHLHAAKSLDGARSGALDQL